MVDWIVFLNIYHVVASLLCLHLPKLLALLHIYNSTYRLVSQSFWYRVGLKGIINLLSG